MNSSAFGYIGTGLAFKFLPDFGRSLKAAHSVFSLMDDQKVVFQSEKSLKTKIFGRIEFKNVYFKYSGAIEYTLKGLSFKVSPN